MNIIYMHTFSIQCDGLYIWLVCCRWNISCMMMIILCWCFMMMIWHWWNYVNYILLMLACLVKRGPMCMFFDVVVIAYCESCVHVVGTLVLIMLWPRSYGGDRVWVDNSYGGELVKCYLWRGSNFVVPRFKSEPNPMVGILYPMMMEHGEKWT